jgi:hypothetical protein
MGGIICSLYFLYAYFNGVLAFYAIQQVAQAGWSPVFSELCRELLLFYFMVRISLYFNALWSSF